MVAQRVVSSNYLGIGLAIATGVAASLAASLQAQAQDLNLQTQINIITPPLTTQTIPQILPPPAPAPAPFVMNECMRQHLQRIQSAMRVHSKKLRNKLLEEANQGVCPAALVRPPPVPGLGNRSGQPTNIYVGFPFNPTYETDVLKSGNNSSPGMSAGFGGNVLLTTAGLKDRPYDLIAFAAGSASSRYPSYPSKSLDTTGGYAAYQFFLDAYGYNEKGKLENITVDNPKDPKDIPAQNMTTFDTLALEIQNQTAFMPTYRAEIANLLTPQFILSRQNIDLSGHGEQCFAKSALPPANEGFCYYASLSLTVGQTFSDVLSQQNANIAGSAAVGWRVPYSDWNLSLQTSATARDYENFVGGRSDLLLQAGPMFTYTPNSNVTLSLPITYFKNYSTVSAAAWSGLIIQPTLTIAFTYTPPAMSSN